MNHKNENLERLLRQFVDQSQARRMAEDMGYADNIFDTHPAPSVSQKTISSLKQNVRYRLKHHKHSKIKWISTAAAVAMALIGLFSLYSNIGEISNSSLSVVQNKPLWIEDFDTADVAAAEIENEMTHLFEAVESIDAEPYEPVNTLQLNLIQIEYELTTDSTEFWKG